MKEKLRSCAAPDDGRRRQRCEQLIRVLFHMNSINASGGRGNPMASDVLAPTRPLVDAGFNPPEVGNGHKSPDKQLVYDTGVGGVFWSTTTGSRAVAEPITTRQRHFKNWNF